MSYISYMAVPDPWVACRVESELTRAGFRLEEDFTEPEEDTVFEEDGFRKVYYFAFFSEKARQLANTINPHPNLADLVSALIGKT